MILTDEKGRPFLKPERSEFPDGIEGTIAHQRAFYAYKDAITDCANKAFAEAFAVALTR